MVGALKNKLNTRLNESRVVKKKKKFYRTSKKKLRKIISTPISNVFVEREICDMMKSVSVEMVKSKLGVK